MAKPIQTYKSVNAFMKDVRKKNNKTSKYVGDAIGVSDKYILLIEQRKKMPAMDRFIKFAQHFGYKINNNAIDFFLNDRFKFHNQEEPSSKIEESGNSNGAKINEKSETNDLEDIRSSLQQVDKLSQRQQSLLSTVQQYLKDTQNEIKEEQFISFDKLKGELLLIKKEWDNNKRDDSYSTETDQEPKLTKNNVYLEKDDSVIEISVHIDLNMATFYVPKLNIDSVKPLIDIFQSPVHSYNLMYDPSFKTNDDIIQLKVVNLAKQIPNAPGGEYSKSVTPD